MAFCDHLLEQAQHLANREPRRPRQASLRRAVSTAYYALFHLLTSEAVSNWKRKEQRAQLARAFEHRRMKECSKDTANPQKSPFAGHDSAVVEHLRTVADAFTTLQHNRHIADYDNSTQWTRTEVLAHIDRAVAAFSSWRTIRDEVIAQDYLVSLLVKER
jgi:hypothetical protein